MRGDRGNSDAFSKREQADENYYVRQKEMEKLQALKQKIADQQKHLHELDKNVYVPLPSAVILGSGGSRYADEVFTKQDGTNEFREEVENGLVERVDR